MPATRYLKITFYDIPLDLFVERYIQIDSDTLIPRDLGLCPLNFESSRYMAFRKSNLFLSSSDNFRL